MRGKIQSLHETAVHFLRNLFILFFFPPGLLLLVCLLVLKKTSSSPSSSLLASLTVFYIFLSYLLYISRNEANVWLFSLMPTALPHDDFLLSSPSDPILYQNLTNYFGVQLMKVSVCFFSQLFPLFISLTSSQYSLNLGQTSDTGY